MKRLIVRIKDGMFCLNNTTEGYVVWYDGVIKRRKRDGGGKRMSLVVKWWLISNWETKHIIEVFIGYPEINVYPGQKKKAQMLILTR